MDRQRLVTILVERPIVQTLFFLALESVAIIMTNVGYCLEDDRIAEIYGNVLFIVAPCIYLFLFLGCLVLFATAFLRDGWARKILWLCSFAITVSLLLLLFGLHYAFHAAPMLRGADILAWYMERFHHVLNEFFPWCLLVPELLAVQWFVDHIECRLRKKRAIDEGSSGNINHAKHGILCENRRVAGVKVLLGMFAGIAMFLFVTRAWVRVDHSQDATIGPCTYYGRPWPFAMSAPGLSIMYSAGLTKLHYLALDLLFWWGVAWLLLFAPEIMRKRKP